MDNFEALLSGARNDYYGGSWGINPDEYGIPAERHEAFLLGAGLSCGRFMVVSADSMADLDRDANNYNKAALAVDEFFGKGIVAPYEQFIADPNEFTILNPETGERTKLFNHFV